MKIKRLVIENFKSIERIELVEPNPFTVFVGPNGSGKSNIFEALEFINLSSKIAEDIVDDMFGGWEQYLHYNSATDSKIFLFESVYEFFESLFLRRYNDETIDRAINEGKALSVSIKNMDSDITIPIKMGHLAHRNFFQKDPFYDDIHEELNNQLASDEYSQFHNGFSRIFIGNRKQQKIVLSSGGKLTLSASNLEKVLKRILTDVILRDEIFEWLDLFVPEFKAVEVDDRNELHWFEKSTSDYFTKDLISDGTYNILALLTAVYQSNEPQFLCIEEPENGLHPEVLMTLVEFFRKQCEEKGHYIWLNTHSESLVRQLTTDEIILVNKREGATQTRQIKGRNIYNIPTEQAWLTGALGGGLPW